MWCKMSFKALLLALLLCATSVWSYAIDDRARNESRIKYELFTRENPTEPQILQLDDLDALEQSNFDPDLPTKFFAHGWNADASSAYSSRNEYLAKEACNFFAIDWKALSTGIDYPLIILRNVPVAANHTGEFIDFLVENTQTSLDKFHLIGFSAGAHVVGGAGAVLSSGKVPRITGLDPAAPFLSLDDTDGRLDTTDADFVDVIHTNGGDLLDDQLGFIEPIGHVDFYPNGGQAQPGCTANNIESGQQGKGGCDHGRSVGYFAESINSAIGFVAVPCESWEDFQAGLCDSDDETTKLWMGEPTPSTSRGVYYLATNDAKPYALG